jgi:hypothetical protein
MHSKCVSHAHARRHKHSQSLGGQTCGQIAQCTNQLDAAGAKLKRKRVRGCVQPARDARQNTKRDPAQQRT